LALLLLLAGADCAALFHQTRPERLIGSMLRLESAPRSVRNAECESWGLTDVLTTCYFDINPAEFPALLRGWAFRQHPSGGGSHSVASGPKVGPDFTVATEFYVQNPPEFPNGGHVILVVDGSRTKARLDYYQE
jgi:hypothetical protein